MIFELVYTSAPKGLFVGNTGFSVVGCTKNMDLAICRQLENLSAYTPLYPHYDSRAWSNPVNFAHRIINVSGKQYHVLSRICFNGLDYTQRSNKLASHLAISQDEIAALPSGPASIFFQNGLFKDEKWQIKTEYFDFPPTVVDPRRELEVCKTWQQASGDAGWAGVIAESLLSNPQKNVYVVFDPERAAQNIYLVSEILSLLPPQMRWQITFSTYFTELPAGVTCNLRFCLPSCQALSNAKQNPSANFIVDLSSPLPPANGGILVTTARTGKNPTPAMPEAGSIIMPQMPQQYVQIQQNSVPSSSGAKIAAYVLLVALIIVGSLFVIFKNIDKNKILSLNKDIAQNRKTMAKALSLSGRSLLIRCQALTQAENRLPSLSDISGQREKVSSFIKKYDIDVKKAKGKNFGVKTAQDHYVMLNKLLERQFALVAQLHRCESFAQEEKKLVDDINEYQATLEAVALGKEVEPSSETITYTPRADIAVIKAMLTMANNNISQIRELQSLLIKKFPQAKFPVAKVSGPAMASSKSISVAQAPFQQASLFKALNQRQTYTVSFSDLLSGAEIKSVYWGKDSMKNSKSIYSTFVNGNPVEIKIDLSKGALKIIRMDKSKTDVPMAEFSIQVIKGKDSQWIEFYFSERTKVTGSDQLFFETTPDGFSVKFPVPQELQDNPDILKDIVATLIYSDKKSALALQGGKMWLSKTLTFSSAKSEQLHLVLVRMNAIKKQFRSNMQNMHRSKFFTAEIEKLDAFSTYDKSRKGEADLETLIDAAVSSIPIDKLGVNTNDIPAEYRSKTLPEAQAAIEKDICKAFQSGLGTVYIVLENHSKSWQQKITIKDFKRGAE